MSFTLVFRLFFVLCLRNSGTIAQVTLRLVNEQACSEDNLTFSCGTNTSGLLVWTLVDLPGVRGVVDSFGQSLNSDPDAVRITSTDTISGPNPSSITIRNATAADNEATVQCRIVNMEMSNIITLSIRPLECSLAVDVSAVTDSHITVTWTWTNCKENEPISISLRWFPTQNSGIAADISSVPARFEITGLEPNTNYNITASFSDACGNISAMAVAATMPRTNSTSLPVSPTSTAASSTSLLTPTPPDPGNIPAILGGTVGGLIVVVLFVIIIIVVAVVIIKQKNVKKAGGERLTAQRGEEMVDVHGDTTYAAPDKNKAAAEGGDGVYSYAATTTVVGAQHSKPGGETKATENVFVQPEKPMRGSKKQPPPADVPHKQGPVGDLYAMPDKKAQEVGHKAGPQGDMYAMAAKPSKGGYGAEGP